LQILRIGAIEGFRTEVGRFSHWGYSSKDAGIRSRAMGFTGIDADSKFMRSTMENRGWCRRRQHKFTIDMDRTGMPQKFLMHFFIGWGILGFGIAERLRCDISYDLSRKV
jgi:hypothetical protein